MKGVIIYKLPIAHTDHRRTIMTMFNGDFVARQIKILEVKRGNILGNHFHRYAEIRWLQKGKAKYKLKNVATGEEMDFIMNEGEVMMIESFIAHAAKFLKNSTMIEATEQPYQSAQINDEIYNLW